METDYHDFAFRLLHPTLRARVVLIRAANETDAYTTMMARLANENALWTIYKVEQVR